MVEFSRLITTRKGQELNAKMIAGVGLVQFTKVCTSDTAYQLGELENLEVLDSIKQTASISSISRTNEIGVKIETIFSNYELKTGYYMRTLGLYASDPDENEILYAVAISVSDQCYMPPNNGITLSSAYINLIYAVGNSENVSLNVDPGCFATIGDLKDIQKQLGKKADLDASGKILAEQLPATESKDDTVTFSTATKRENIASGEKHSTIFGKIAKFFADLKTVAFTGSYNDLSDKPTNFSPSSHKHTKSEITDFPSSMPASDVSAWAKATNKPSYNWSEIGSKPQSFPPSSHNHTKSNITDFPSSLPASDVYSWAKASSKPSYTATEVGALPVNGGTITGGLSVNSGLSVGGGISFGGGGIFQISKGYYSGNYHVANFRDEVNDAGIGFTSTGRGDCSLHPHADGVGALGAGYRWNQVYAVNSTISTSDRNEKENISYIGMDSKYKDTCMSDEQLVEFFSGILPCIFKRINGESGRPHHGIIAQDFEELLKKVGLHDHAAFIKSPKTEEIEVTNEDGSKEIKVQEIPGEYIYGIRYEELISDVIRFCQILKNENRKQKEKIENLEERIAKLENNLNT